MRISDWSSDVCSSDLVRRYSARFIIGASRAQMAGDAQVTAHHVAELRIAFGRPHGGEMADRPEPETDQPEAQAEAERRRQRAVKNGDRARRAAEQDVLGERPMDRSEEHTSELQSLMRTSYAVFRWKKK